MSKVIKRLNGDSIDISNMAMEKFYSQEQVDEIKKSNQDLIKVAEAEAEKIIGDAKSQAQEIIDQAKKESEDIKVDAKREGLSAGETQARERVEAEFNEVIDATNRIKDMVDQNTENVFASIENQLIELVIDICRRIIGYQVQIDKEIVVSIIQKCLSMTKERNHIVVQVNPDDFEMVEQKKQVFLQKVRGLKEIEIVESEAVAAGGCILETSTGDVNADIEEQLLKIKEAMLGK